MSHEVTTFFISVGISVAKGNVTTTFNTNVTKLYKKVGMNNIISTYTISIAKNVA